jgi:acetolactate synthase-1/2/3 large subunit
MSHAGSYPGKKADVVHDETGSKAICDALLRAGIDVAFGLPGTQNVALYEALRTSSLRTVVATNELSAAMMANGYYRASGRVAALVTIPGPGFMWALTGVAEASLDSAALIHLVGLPAAGPGARFQLQAIDQIAIARPLVRALHRIDRAADIADVIRRAHADALEGEPGPVIVHVDRAVLEERSVPRESVFEAPPAARAMDGSQLAEAVRMLSTGRSLILAGQGCSACPDALVRLAEALSATVVTTTSGRGVMAEDHALSLGFEFGGDTAETLNALVAASDVVLAIGCKFSHNGSRGFRLEIPPEKLIHVDTSAEVLGANYPARIAMRADAGAFLDAVLASTHSAPRRGFDAATVADFRARARAETLRDRVEPRIHGVASGTPAEFFAILRKAMPREATLTTDSGLHQSLARRHFRVLHPRGLLTPTNLQSMGFGIGAAIGACVANPHGTVVALIGDGGLLMSGLELAAAVRERLRLVVIVFVDGAYGLIRFQQLSATGQPFATEFEPPDVAALAQTVGANYVRVDGDVETQLREVFDRGGVTLVEVAVGDTLPMRWMQAKTVAKKWIGPRARRSLRRLLGRR